MTQTTQPPTAALPPEVTGFASEQGVGIYLPAVLAMTRRIFPGATLGVVVDEDPEIANDRHLVIRVQGANLEVPQALEARYRWHRELFTACPAPLVCVFRLGLERGA